MPVLTIDKKNFISGESQTESIADRGFSPRSYGLNLTYDRGLLHLGGDTTDRGGSLVTSSIVAACTDPDLLGNDNYFVDVSGRFYEINGATVTTKQISLHTYALGTSDMIPFLGSVFATHNTGIVKLSSNFGAIEDEWWSGLSDSYRHPLERVESEMFVADKNVIYYWNGAASGIAFTLPTDVNVTTMRRHTDGRTLLAFTGETANFSHTVPSKGKVYYCDPVIRDWTREVVIEAQVEGSRLHGGTIFTTYGNTFGFFDGNGLQPIKKLETSTTTYSHSMTSYDEILYVRDGRIVKAHGDLGNGPVWWNAFRNLLNKPLTAIISKGDNKLMVSDDGTTLTELDFDLIGGGGKFYSNPIYFDTEVKIRKIVILHETTDSAGTTAITLNYRDLESNENVIEEISYVNQTLSRSIIQTDISTDITTIVPTATPRKFSEQFQIVVSGGTSSLYVYDTVNRTWKSSSLIT